MLLLRQTKHDKNEDITDSFETTVQEKEDEDEYELPPITSTEQTNKESEDVSTHDDKEDGSTSDSKNSASDTSKDEDKSPNTENSEGSDEQTETDNENTDEVGSDDNTEITLPFVPAN